MTTPQSLNQYSYVGNGPVNFVDPTGLCTFNTTIAGSGVSNDAYEAMTSEIMRIFAQAGHKVVFGRPDLADRSYNINIVPTAPASASPRALAITRGWRDGRIDPGGALYLGRVQNALAQERDPALRSLARRQESFGRALGRVVAREAGHFFLPLPNTMHTAEGLMRAQFTGNADLFRTGDLLNAMSQFDHNQAVQLGLLCMYDPTGAGRNVAATGGGGGGAYGGSGGGGYPSWWYAMWGFLNWIKSIPVGPLESDELIITFPDLD